MTAATVRVLPRFPGRVVGISGLSALTSGGVLTIGLDPSTLADSADPTASGNFTFILNTTTGDFEKAPVASTVVDIATQGEAEAGNDNTAINTPLRTSQQTTARLASEAEAVAGTDTAKLVSPARVRDAVEQSAFTVDEMANPETLAAIINRTGLTPQMLGAQSTDTDHANSWNSAIDRLIVAGGGTLWLPKIQNNWKLGSVINCHRTGYQSSHLAIRGVGDKPIISVLSSTADVFAVGDGTNPVYDVLLENFYIEAAQNRTAGRDFNLLKANQVIIRNIVSQGCCFGLWAQDFNDCTMEDFKFLFSSTVSSSGRGVTLFSDASGTNRSDVFNLNRGTVQGYNQGGAGILISGRVATVFGERVGMLGVTRGLAVSSTGSSLSDIPTFIRFRALEVDRASDQSLVADQGYELNFTDCDFSNTTGVTGVTADTNAVSVGAGVQGIKFLGGRVGLCRQHGMFLNGKNMKVVGTDVYQYGRQTSNVYHGILLGASADGFSIVSPTVNADSFGAYAVAIDASAKNGTIRDVIYKGVVSGYSTGAGTNIDNTGQKLATY